MRRRLLLAVATVATGACGSFQSAIPVLGPPADRTALVGHWEGEFESASHRSGVVDFDLAAPADTAIGVVVLIPRAPPNDDAGRERRHAPTEALEIEFIEVEGTVVRGALRVYPDPFDGSRLRTTFQGRLQGDEVSGTYEVQSLDTGDRVTGHWEMRRRDR